MNKHQIGLNAGVVWRLLNDNKRWSYCELKKAKDPKNEKKQDKLESSQRSGTN